MARNVTFVTCYMTNVTYYICHKNEMFKNENKMKTGEHDTKEQGAKFIDC